MGKWENHGKTIEKTWENGGLPSGKRLHNYGKSRGLMGKLDVSMVMFNSKL